MDIRIQLDTAEFERRMEASAKEVVKALRSSVNKAAREARRDFVTAASQDTGLSAGIVRKAIEFKPAGEANLTARMIVKKHRVSPLEVGGSLVKTKGGSYIKLKTLMLSGGDVPTVHNVFQMQTSGKPFILQRIASAAGLKRHSTKGTKAIYVASPGSVLAHERLQPRQRWERTATGSIERALAANVQVALDGGHVHTEDGNAP